MTVDDRRPPMRRAEEVEPILRVRPEVGVAKPDPILVVEGVRRSFGGLVAVDIDHLEVQRGVVTSLIGPNGAGKTTLFQPAHRIRSSRLRSLDLAGRPVNSLSSDRLARQGMVRTFQLTKSLARLPVVENMLLGRTAPGGGTSVVRSVRVALARPGAGQHRAR